MYLTRMQLDAENRAVMKAMVSPNRIHGAIEAAFPGERRRKLWRLDRLNGKLYLLLLSEDRPDLTNMACQFAPESNGNCAWETKSYQPLLDRITDGSTWRFRLTANPTICNKNASDKTQRGTVHAHITVNHQKEWLANRAKQHGFLLKDDDFTVTNSQWKTFYKPSGHKVQLLSVSFEGTLTVTDAQKFRDVLLSGLGRGKAYGLGLLTVARSEA